MDVKDEKVFVQGLGLVEGKFGRPSTPTNDPWAVIDRLKDRLEITERNLADWKRMYNVRLDKLEVSHRALEEKLEGEPWSLVEALRQEAREWRYSSEVQKQAAEDWRQACLDVRAKREADLDALETIRKIVTGDS